MAKRIILILAVFLVMGLGALEMIQWQFGIGSYARSPQSFTLRQGQRFIAGGGRVVVGLLQIRGSVFKPYGVLVEMSCKDTKQDVALMLEEPGDEVCGTRILWQGAAQEGKGQYFQAIWE